MTRKDYEVLAKALSSGFQMSKISLADATVIFNETCSVLKSDNANFNKDKFNLAVFGKETTNVSEKK